MSKEKKNEKEKDDLKQSIPEEETEKKEPEEPLKKEETDDAKSGEAADSPAQDAKPDEEDLQTKYLRLAADFQNFRRRTEKEKADIYAYANEKLVKELLDVIDNFERAMQAGSSDEKFAEGMQLILKQLQDVLTKNNVEEIKAEGAAFDPNFHNAVMAQAAEGVESGTIINVLQKGYLLNSRVIRPSMVVVAE